SGHNAIPDDIPDRTDRDDYRGLGMFLMQSLMDRIEISSQPGRNEVHLISYLGCSRKIKSQ
ncbi:MAG: ATP-binding protein, partial [Chloroflexota bacterium]